MDYQKVYLTEQANFAFHKLCEILLPPRERKQFLYASVLYLGDNIILKMSLKFVLNAL